jgi:MinD-like ATPase involved in chromosome partitioning or flagellar assembly
MSLMSNRPDGRLIPVFAVDDGLRNADIVLALSKTAAARGETVLMLDQMGGHLMDKAGVVVGATLADVLDGSASMSDAKYINHNEHFTAVSAGGADLDMLLGSLAAMSLSYDWVFIGTRPGCTPAHIRLAGAADAALVVYNSCGDKFMRAYWMLDAIRTRVPKFDPLMLAQISKESCEVEGLETFDLLAGTVRDFLGAAPALGGILDSSESALALAPALLEALRQDSNSLRKYATA